MVIIEPSKQALPDDELPSDAPPSYDTLQSPTRSSASYPRDEKRLYPLTPPLSGHSSQSPTRPTSSGGGEGSNPLRSKRASATKAKGPSYWFNFGPSKTTKEVNSTVLNLVRDLVKQTSSSTGASGILDSCAEACEGYDVSFSSLLQQRSIEGHTPIYWAIIKRPSEPPNPEDHDLVTALLSRSTPLTPSTISDIRLACLTTSDQVLFQRLRFSPAFSPMSGTDEMLLGGTIPPDEIEVEDVDNDGGSFVARFKILKFQNRMRISKSVHLEFIARGRLWRLSFFVAISSKWTLGLSILEHSPPTWVDSRLIIDEPPPLPPSTSNPAPSLIDAPIPSTSPSPRSKPTKSKPKPSISIRLRPREELYAIQDMKLIGFGISVPKPPIAADMEYGISVPLEENALASSLQYDGCSYLDAEGTLHARLEARLARPEADCVIC